MDREVTPPKDWKENADYNANYIGTDIEINRLTLDTHFRYSL